MEKLRMTLHAQAVLRELLSDPGGELYGLEIAQRTGLRTGTVYPILSRLIGLGWVVDRLEDVDPHAERRPQRRYNRLTEYGVDAAREALANVDPAFARNVGSWATTKS